MISKKYEAISLWYYHNHDMGSACEPEKCSITDNYYSIAWPNPILFNPINSKQFYVCHLLWSANGYLELNFKFVVYFELLKNFKENKLEWIHVPHF